MSIKEKNDKLQNKRQLKINIYIANWDHRKLKVYHEQVEVTPEDVYRTKYTQLARVAGLSQPPVLSVLSSNRKKSPEIISFIN